MARQTVKRLAALSRVATPNILDPDGTLDEQLVDILIAALEWAAARKAARQTGVFGPGSTMAHIRLAKAEAKLQAEVDK